MKLYSIQFLRAVAAILVVYCHSIDLQMKFSTSFQQNFFFLQDFGAIGVDIFFVISGFIISFITSNLNGHQATFLFLQKRFVRINPTYYFFSIISFLIILIQYNTRSSYKSIIKTVLILPIEPGGIVWWPILSIGWTLSFEWFFYLIFSILIFNKATFKELYLIFTLIILVALGAIFKTQLVFIKFITHPIILEFGAGAIIGWLFKNRKINSKIAFLFLIVSIICFVLLILFGYSNVSESNEVLNGRVTFLRFIYFGIPSILLVFSCIFLEKNLYTNKVWKNRLFQLLGDSSYSIYLVHTIVFMFFNFLYNKTGIPMYPDMVILIQVFAAILVGVYCHLYIEKTIITVLSKAIENVKLFKLKKYSFNKTR